MLFYHIISSLLSLMIVAAPTQDVAVASKGMEKEATKNYLWHDSISVSMPITCRTLDTSPSDAFIITAYLREESSTRFADSYKDEYGKRHPLGKEIVEHSTEIKIPSSKDDGLWKFTTPILSLPWKKAPYVVKEEETSISIFNQNEEVLRLRYRFQDTDGTVWRLGWIKEP